MSSSISDLTEKYTQHWFEQKIDSLSIKEGKEEYLRNQVNHVKKQLAIASSDWLYNSPETPIQEFSNIVMTFQEPKST